MSGNAQERYLRRKQERLKRSPNFFAGRSHMRWVKYPYGGKELITKAAPREKIVPLCATPRTHIMSGMSIHNTTDILYFVLF